VSAADSPKSTDSFSSPLHEAESTFLSESVSLPESLHNTGVSTLAGGEDCARGCVAVSLRHETREARNDIWLCIAFSCCVTASSLCVRLRFSDSNLDSRVASDELSTLSWKLADSSVSTYCRFFSRDC
jgi:hypothetical protein